MLLQNRVWILGGDLLNVHAARGGCHEDGLAFGAIDENAKVQFFVDRQRFFDQQAAHDAALGAGLVRYQFHSEHLAREFAGFVHRLGDLHAAALAAASSMNLRLDHYSARARVE